MNTLLTVRFFHSKITDDKRLVLPNVKTGSEKGVKSSNKRYDT